MRFMRNTLFGLATAAAGVGMIAWSAPAWNVQGASLLAVEDDHEVNGKIASVNTEDNSFVINTGESEMTLFITARTKFTLNGEESTREKALQEGAEAKIKHRAQVALEVHVMTE